MADCEFEELNERLTPWRSRWRCKTHETTCVISDVTSYPQGRLVRNIEIVCPVGVLADNEGELK